MSASALDIQWSQALFKTLRDGGVWGVPRSGLVFEKRGQKLVLISMMPYVKEMPGTPEQLHAYQMEDYRLIREKFGQAGVIVESWIDGLHTDDCSGEHDDVSGACIAEVREP